MLKPSPNFFSNSLSTQNQLVDSLTAHISLYHFNSSSSNPNHQQQQQPRSVILKWFSSLTVHQRQSHLTAVDHNFIQLLIQMLGKLRAHGHGRFIILPDLPSRGLPGLCFKKSRGLLSRLAESNDSERSIFESTRLFDSREGENVRECTCFANCLDSITVSEEVVEDVDKFVEMMDTVSNGEFLRGEESRLGSDWVELEWLKARGYYSIEAFVANRLEVALRLAWMNSTSGKKRGVKLKEKLAAAGTAANVFWRKKGCVDWWRNLDPRTRRNFMTAALGKSARSLTCEILEGRSRALEDEMWLFRAGAEQPIRYTYAGSSRHASMRLSDDVEFRSAVMPTSLFGKPSSLANVFNCLLVLQDIVTVLLPGQHSEYDISKAFFSTLGSVNTFSDCIFRKLRGLVMAISLDCTKLELLGEGNFKPNKPKEKLTAGSCRKKGKTHNVKKLNVPPVTGDSGSSFEKSVKDLDCAMAHSEKAASNEVPVTPHGKQVQKDISSTTVDEHSQGSVLGKGRSATRKGRRGKNKKQKSSINNPVEVRDSQGSVGESPCLSAFTLDMSAMRGGLCANECIENDVGAKVVQEDLNVQGMCQRTSEYCESSDSLAENQTTPSRPETSDCKIQCNGVSHVVSPTEPDAFSSNKDMNPQNKNIEAEQCFTEKTVETVKLMKDIALIQGQENKSVSDFGSISPLEPLSYEWPSLAPVYFPSINSHLPPATDRLHLDVGHSWHNHIRQSLVPTVRQARNPVIESGCSRMLSRPLAMSLDWPPVVRSTYGLAPTVTCNYDSGFISRRQATFQQNFVAQNMQFNAKTNDDERIYSGDFVDLPEAINTQELMDECESHWISEEEFDVHAVSGRDYNQYFGDGVMYWNPSDHPGAGFSRPPSLSSDDSSWAWREADMNRAVDDMVAFSSSYSTNGLTSPTAASFCSPLDPLGPGHQALGYVVSGNEVAGKVQHSSPTVTDSAADEETAGSLVSLSGDVEGKASDSLPYPILRPIIIPSISRERRVHDRKSPCVPPTRREQQRIKRPPSPVVLCVPRAPRPPPPSPVSDSRRHRGFPTVRSGSSSPRHWGVRGWYQEGTNLEDGCVRMDGAEVVWPSWRNNNLSTHPMIQPLPGALLQDHLIAISKLSRDQEHPDVSFPLQPPEPQNCPTRKASLLKMHSLLHDEMDCFCKQVAAANMARKPLISWAVKRVTRSLQVLWPRSRTNVFGSNATGLSLPSSDVDLVVCLPPVRNLEPIKEAGILEGRNGIKETCLQHAARYLANQDWVKNDSLKTVENTAIPIIMLVVEVPSDLVASSASNVQSPKEDLIQMAGEHDNHVQLDIIGVEDSSSPKSSLEIFDCRKDVQSVRLDISFKSSSHTGLQTTELVKELTEQFPAATPLALVLKQFLADRSLDQSYSGGLSSYCLVILITRFLQHEHHLGRPINQVMNLGCLLMDFLYFFGNVFDPRQMRISVQGSGVYINRERGYSIDPIHIDDPLFPTNNVGRNCFRIHQCIKAFSEAYSILENELICLQEECDTSSRPSYRLLPKIVPSINSLLGN